MAGRANTGTYRVPQFEIGRGTPEEKAFLVDRRRRLGKARWPAYARRLKEARGSITDLSTDVMALTKKARAELKRLGITTIGALYEVGAEELFLKDVPGDVAHQFRSELEAWGLRQKA